jgi:hypothetical protein
LNILCICWLYFISICTVDTAHSIMRKEIFYYLGFIVFVHNLANYTPVLTDMINHHS